MLVLLPVQREDAVVVRNVVLTHVTMTTVAVNPITIMFMNIVSNTVTIIIIFIITLNVRFTSIA